MIAIIDCHIGNIGSLRNALSYLGAASEVVSEPERLAGFRSVILPGVGAFDAAMGSLRQTGFDRAVTAFVSTGRPLLGICLGFQILCRRSEEGQLPGLGLIPADVVRLNRLGCTGKVPHVGFNAIDAVDGQDSFLADVRGEDFYFVHSFGVDPATLSESAASKAYVHYDNSRFIAAVQQDNVFGTQFHPEKSGEAGVKLLSRFVSCSRSD